ncbi:hypothetical protein PUN28_019976 [Cardiocondyla obscurior]|uniref:Uncharacterized protein n=1 Tax=Cardiocondyla obscurior TaxID=286306 RepID=A0AAW2E8A9_9HYME
MKTRLFVRGEGTGTGKRSSRAMLSAGKKSIQRAYQWLTLCTSSQPVRREIANRERGCGTTRTCGARRTVRACPLRAFIPASFAIPIIFSTSRFLSQLAGPPLRGMTTRGAILMITRTRSRENVRRHVSRKACTRRQ